MPTHKSLYKEDYHKLRARGHGNGCGSGTGRGHSCGSSNGYGGGSIRIIKAIFYPIEIIIKRYHG